MAIKEADHRAAILRRVHQGELSLGQASQLLKVSYRQMKRINRRYLTEGVSGLAHRNKGRQSNRAKPADVKRLVLELVSEMRARANNGDFGPSYAATRLREAHGLEVDSETLRRWMLAEGLWTLGLRHTPQKPVSSDDSGETKYGDYVLSAGA